MATEPENCDNSNYKISVCINGTLDESGDWFEPYVTRLHIYIQQEWWCDEQQAVRHRDAGHGEGFKLHVGAAVNDRELIAEVCDAHSSEAAEYCAAVLQADANDWREDVREQFDGDLYEPDLLVIHKMEVLPQHRGQRLGQLAVLRTMQLFEGGCGLTLIKPWPLQYDAKHFEQIRLHGKTDEGWTAKTRQQDFQKLRRYWGVLGFRRIGKSDFYAFPGSRPLPTFKSLLRKK